MSPYEPSVASSSSSTGGSVRQSSSKPQTEASMADFIQNTDGDHVPTPSSSRNNRAGKVFSEKYNKSLWFNKMAENDEGKITGPLDANRGKKKITRKESMEKFIGTKVRIPPTVNSTASPSPRVVDAEVLDKKKGEDDAKKTKDESPEKKKEVDEEEEEKDKKTDKENEEIPIEDIGDQLAVQSSVVSPPVIAGLKGTPCEGQKANPKKVDKFHRHHNRGTAPVTADPTFSEGNIICGANPIFENVADTMNSLGKLDKFLEVPNLRLRGKVAKAAAQRNNEGSIGHVIWYHRGEEVATDR